MKQAKVYLIPTVLADDENAIQAIPAYVLNTIQNCKIIFAENQRTARRFFKKLCKQIVIDEFIWYTIQPGNEQNIQLFLKHLQNGETIGIVSEAGCPGVADPGQHLVNIAQKHHAVVQPLAGPNSIILALMASGLNGQQFCFHGYLPIEKFEKRKLLKQIEADSKKNHSTQIFIETPYRNNQLLQDMMEVLSANTLLCIASAITSANEYIKTKSIAEWKKNSLPDLHKKPSIFLIQSQ